MFEHLGVNPLDVEILDEADLHHPLAEEPAEEPIERPFGGLHPDGHLAISITRHWDLLPVERVQAPPPRSPGPRVSASGLAAPAPPEGRGRYEASARELSRVETAMPVGGFE